MKGAVAIYSQFGDIVFGPIPKALRVEAMPSLIRSHAKHGFAIFMDDYIAAAESFQALFDFLHKQYFPRVAFGPVYFALYKTYVFINTLETVGFSGGVDGLRPAVKHKNWAIL